MAFIRAQRRVTRAEYQEMSNLPAHTAKRVLAKLVEAGFVVRCGGGRDYWYELRDIDGAPQGVPLVGEDD